jgi:gas vesicle protein
MNTYMEGVRDALTRVGLVHSSTSAWMTGFAIGAGIGLVSGAAVALLLTPTNGREMRREIGSRAKRLAEKTQGALSDVTDTVKDTVKGKLSQVEGHRGHNEVTVR